MSQRRKRRKSRLRPRLAPTAGYMVDAEGNVYDEEGYEIGTWDEEAKAVIA